MKRRTFLKTSTAALSSLFTARVLGANDRVIVGIMGVRGRGKSLAREFAALSDVEVAYICDVDQNVVAPALRIVEKAKGKKPKVVGDFRRILDDPAVNALVVATPDHWHAPATILACQAGKDVYVEKPISHNLREGRLMVQAARKYNRVVQVGTQNRSRATVQAGIELAHSGQLGKILMAKAWNSQRRKNIGRKSDGAVPHGVDYDMWLGPAPKRPFNPNRFHYNWHWIWDYGTGDMGNDGVHQLDIARWALDVDYPQAAGCSGAKLFFDDDQETPDTQIAAFEYPDKMLLFEMRIWAPYKMEGADNGVAVYGSEGYMILDRQGWKVYTRDNHPGPNLNAVDLPDAHYRNFVECVRTRQRPVCDIEIGYLSTVLVHIGNIAMRVGRKLHFNSKTESFVDDKEANGYLSRAYRQPWLLTDNV